MDNWQAFVPAAAPAGERAEAPAGREERARTLSLIDFLADYDARRNPPVYDIGKYGLFLLRDSELPDVPGVRLAPAADAWLAVDFLDLPPRPEVPAELVPLLGESSSMSPHARPSVRVPDAGTGPGEPVPQPDPDVLSAAEGWVAAVWEPFAARWAEVAEAKNLHRALFQQREQLAADRESVELVWGFGRVRWRQDGITVDHPLVTIPVEVEEDEANQQIRVCPAGAPEVEARCLAGLQLADRARFMSVRQSVNDEGLDPWDEQGLRTLLQQLIRAIDHKGTLAEQAPQPAGYAVADSSWVLYMRRRLPDYQGFLARMRELYRDESVAVPDTLQAVVSDSPSAIAGRSAASAGPGEPLLLPLPTNEEQQRILAQAQHSTGVTVQGPPGTGKSHTIANIISHYVAYGKRVLVVAEKEQALRSLTGKIPEGIKDLTVAVLGADADSRRGLESAIGQIQTRVTGIDRTYADERIRQLTADLDAVSRDIAMATQALLSSRETEVQHLPGLWHAGQDPTRAEAARWVAEHADTHGYIDDLVPSAVPAPVSSGELAEFAGLIRQVGVRRADACAAMLPELAAIPAAADLSGRFTEMAQLETSARSVDGAVRDWKAAIAQGREGLQALAERCQDEMEWMAKTAGSWQGQVREQAEDPLLARDWEAFRAQLSRDRQEALMLRGVLTSHAVRIPEVVEPSFVQALTLARDRLAQSGKLGMFAGPAKRAVQQCEIDGRQPTTLADIEACLQAVFLADLRRRMLTSWHNQLARVGGVALNEVVPEDVLGRRLDDLARALAWPRTWARLRSDLAAAGIGSPAAADADTLTQLAHICSRACEQITLEGLYTWRRKLGDWLHAGSQTANASALWKLLADALSGHDVARWQRLREELAELHGIALAAQRLRELRERLAASAPIWTSRMLADPAAAGNPAEFDAAWQWRQLDTWVRAALSGLTPAQLQSRLEELSRQRRLVVTDLVSERAWRRLADNLGDRERQALNSYVRAVTRFGKTGGKFAQRWLAEIRAALNESKDAVPVWIMPTARALSSFRPEAYAPFDVLVVDEASQIGLEALPLLALATKTIIVGDDKQTSPENVGLSRQLVFDLLDEHLSKIPKYKTLFDPDGSLYDIAFQKFPGVVMLTEHFRCLPQIIAFSNAHAYSNRIIPLRDQAPRPDWPALGAIRVTDGYRNGMVNVPESEAVVDLVAELCANPDYDGMDMGVISLLGTAQSKLIADKLYDRLGPEVLHQRQLRSGEPGNFQGDERDVIIISTVVAVDPAVPAARVSAMTNTAAMRRINVAASRARQQMWVVHSVDAESFPDGDLRGALIRHCRDAGATTAPATGLVDACESQFERDVLQRILARGYQKVSVQHKVGQFRIDMVVEGPHTRLAVECDGDRWHGPDVWHRDRARQQVLERAGWTFERIRGSAFYRDPRAALQPLWDRLTALEIPTGDWWKSQAAQPVVREVSGHAPDHLSHQAEEAAGTGDSASTATQLPERAAPSPVVPEALSADTALASSESRDSPAGSRNGPPGVAGVRLAPYRTWEPHVLPHTDTTPISRIIAGLEEIIAVEGPMHAERAYRLYNQAAGGHRVGHEIRRSFHAATQQALRTGAFQALADGLPPDEKTLHLPGTAPVLVRELGPRQLMEVPRSEVAELIRRLDLNGAPHDVIKRAVLDSYHLVRLTTKTSAYLDECMNYG